MLLRNITRCLLPRALCTSYTSARVGTSPTGLASPSLLIEKRMPTLLIDVPKVENLTCGTGQPAQRGRRKPLVWKRRHPWFDRQWSLDLKRAKKGPLTPQFPEGVPFTAIRSFQSFAGKSWKINAGRRRKIRLSLKRGRRKLL
ncbi:hypothetical protein TcYC6_0054040 [Trypanosoma cruzi]|uniref:Uncharacterized protein n=1 Tax=Trypanosoma cruzi (strain CL Brener) TaxID=353153 RepID=Q4DBA6_TRYCC|nr:hypothetical protein, conserved [Trypanosoma cruzi]EAN89822.1 hypothetical protein, conserved [Trypanosoma cruzi]KAF8301726.1 hypothetical protein TcYC6_0054040 [Trypanosoma cruzi]|eukprot:XP_811673.1 hypothetical protein [Trypanosoma cruzi strain CL Brener]